MIKFLRGRILPSTSLASTRLYDESTFFRAFSADIKQATHKVIIESPYVTVRRATELASICNRLIKNGIRIVIYTRNPTHHDGDLTRQAYIGIGILKDAGIKVKICDDMRHRKIAIIDDSILWEGSLNMLSQINSREIMRRTDSSELCVQMLRFTGLNVKV